MAYGKIKADTLVYDNSGSDVEVTLASLGNKAGLNSPTFTGTPVVPGYAPLAGATFTGNVVMSANLTVQGTTTTISSTTIEVADKNLELGKVDTPTDTTADGGGITLKGATDKTITWSNSTDRWTFNQNIIVTTGQIRCQGIEGGDASVYLQSDEADDNADLWKITNVASDNTLVFQNYGTGNYTTTLKLNPNGAVEDSKGDVRDIPVNGGTSAMTLSASDTGKVVATTTGGWVIPTGLSSGNTFTLLNDSGSDQTINATALTTLYNTADGANVKTSTLTLGARSMATIWMGSGTVGYIQATALTVS